ncbi:MAG: hypothetical protein WC718_02335 [Phycisphaerales bacterium]|jgi:hypothetical protein
MSYWNAQTCGRVVVLGAIGLVTLGGCESGSPVREVSKVPNTGLSSLGAESKSNDLRLISTIDPDGPLSDATKAQLASQAALDLQGVLDKLRNTERPEAPAETSPGSLQPPNAGKAATPSGISTGLGALGGASLPAAPPKPADPVAPPPTLPAPDPKALEAANQAWSGEAPKAADPLLELATNMAGLLKTPNPDGSARIADGVALAAIEAMHPGSIAELDSASSVLGQRLAGDDRAALLAARQRVLAKPDQANQQLIAALTKIAPAAGLKISRAALCTRVQGFGRYDAISNSTFVAGQPIRLIVYTELDHFASRPAKDGDPAQASVPLGDQQSVELSQTLTLYHDPSGLQAWHRPAQRVVETSQRSRRDFYLIHQIELPATLSVGRYSLKVTVTDQTTGAVDEVNLPISITGDASAVPR